VAQHTPGPWGWVRNTRGNVVLVSKAESWGPVAEILMDHSKYTPELQDANAQLIAAAPAMLEALKATWPCVLRDADGYDDHLAQVKAALAQALGQAVAL
ncbi:hypothetical protein LCGC14_3083710, partial [marine sediment metagenome]